MKKRILSLCMALFVTVSMLPARAFASPADSGTVIVTAGLCGHHTQHDDADDDKDASHPLEHDRKGGKESVYIDQKGSGRSPAAMSTVRTVMSPQSSVFTSMMRTAAV